LQNHDFVELFSRFWWLIFPLWWMLVRLIRSLRSTSAQDRALDVLRIYAAKGETPPPEVLKALAQMSGPGADYAAGGAYPPPPPPGRASGAWWTFFVFAALTAGFAVGVNGFGPSDVQAHTAFTIVAVVMAFMAAGSLVMAIFASLRGGR
jgi:hypothetical protein